MKRVISLSVVIAVLATVLPAFAKAAVYKKGVASSRVTSSGYTSNSIIISESGQTRRLFKALTSSAGLADTSATIEGDEPASLTSTGLGAGNAVAKGANTGKARKLMLPVIKGVSNSEQSVSSQSYVSLE